MGVVHIYVRGERNMKRKIFAVLTVALLLCINLSLLGFATYEYGVIPEERIVPLVSDEADLLTDEEETLLTDRLDTLGFIYSVEIGVVTVNSLEGKSAQAFADDYYDYNGYGYGVNDDGLLVLYKDGVPGDREVYITTHGSAVYKFSDYKIDRIRDEMISDLQYGNYYRAFEIFADECEDVLENYEIEDVGGYYGSDDLYYDSGSSGPVIGNVPVVWIPGSIAIGFILALLIMLGVASGLKTVKRQANAAAYVDNMNITAQSDTFLYKNVRKTPRPKSTSSGGGSSGHRSSSGRSHGGGGRRF